MSVYKKIKKIYSSVVTRMYDMTSKRTVMETSKLYDTPNMTKYHHIVSALRYVAVEEHYGENDFGKTMYINANHWENDSALQEDLYRFDTLISSIETKGYDMNSAIYVDLDGNCINGTHRLALCAWFGIKEIPVIKIKRHLKPKTIQEMKLYYELSDEDFSRLESAYERMCKRLQKN